MKLKIGQVYCGRIGGAPFVVMGLNDSRATCKWIDAGVFEISVLSLMDSKKYVIMRDGLYTPLDAETREYDDPDMEQLTKIEHQILSKRFGWRKTEIKEYGQIAEEMGLPDNEVKKIERTAIIRLMKMMEAIRS